MKPIIINGSVRSGTTWLYETFAQNSKLHPIFEPDNYLQDAQKLKLRYKYIRKNDDDEELWVFLVSLLAVT